MLSHIFREQVLVLLLWIAVFVLVRPSQHKSGRWAKKKKNNIKQTNKTKPKTKKETHQELVFQWVFFFFFKVFTACAFYAQGANPTNKTTSVNTASFNSFFVFEKIITLTTCFRFVSRKGQQALKTRTVLFRWEKKFPRVLFSS